MYTCIVLHHPNAESKVPLACSRQHVTHSLSQRVSFLGALDKKGIMQQGRSVSEIEDSLTTSTWFELDSDGSLIRRVFVMHQETNH